ncbi:MFS transporter [Streptomyces cocklensis]|uniref:Predicted arabinose efflux permease, MFS family n=1 Tax=Actinacidiphila cocklensis TaxID=887465 RepID=A0A9W4DVE7_9ACTN|nr:MFS transporter [Actinacidiphila cocklensis]MDD1060256.1 MFS transporter [Actinacidiphila cocklensis]WSX76686.1 MFS transporter [Streptomyces sp. NBC_00899]CAG6394255.1 Predicted arabinose efflux permease, MFS family [Actinacidiphila cocklensis]
MKDSENATTTPGGDSGTPIGYGAVFSVREFRPIFAAHVLSLLGGVLAEVALAVLIFAETGSAVLSALVFALTYLPYALSGLLLSGIADRYPSRRVLVSCDVLSGGCVAAMAIPGAPVVLLFALRVAVSLIAPLFTGTRAASLADILEGERYVLGRSLVRIVAQGSQIAGFGLGGLVLVWLTPRSALLLTACTFAGSALLLRFGTADRPARVTGSGRLMRESIASAGRLMADPRIRALLLMWWVPPMFFIVAEGLAAPFAKAAGIGTVGFGLFLAAMPAGTAVSEVLAGTLLSPAARDRIVLPLAGISLLPLILFAVDPSLPLALVLLVLTGLCAAYALGMDRWFVDDVPDHMRGQAMSLLGAGLMTLQGLGITVGGALAEWAPPYAVIAGSGVAGTLSVLLVLRSVRRTRAVPAALAA